MDRFRAVVLFAPLLGLAAGLNIWPNANSAYDDIEDLYTITGGVGSPGFTVEITPCSNAPFSDGSSGRQSAAEWIRLAFHDMASHNVTDGTGGIDASIQYELSRAQNVGDGQAQTLRIFGQHFGTHRSISDLTALGLVLSMKSCGGPSIPLRVGRIDATKPGPADVPEPQQDIDSHVAAFARAGFNKTEMIILVAAGHSFGGVHQADFPTIVPESEITSTNTEGVQKFLNGATYQNFNNHIATEWIDGTTTNPLVTSFNATMHSDARIFGSDRNVTMRAFAKDPAYFSQQSALLLERMINTVPKEVKLSGLIEPYPIKPENLALTIVNETSLLLKGQIRLFNTNPSVFSNKTKVSAVVTWKDKQGNPGSAFAATNDQGQSISLWGSATMLGVNATIPIFKGISSFVVDYITDSPGYYGNTHGDNGGHGFPMQDMVIWDAARSCQSESSTSIIVAIRKDSGSVTSPYLLHTYVTTIEVDGAFGSGIGQETVTLVPAPHVASHSSHYTMYNGTAPHANTATFTVGATVNGKKYAQSADIITTGLPPC